MNAFIVTMPWTGEDTKDVFKKVLGGLIAAAVIAIGYALVEEMAWYYAAALATVLLVLVVLLAWRMRGAADTGEERQEHTPAPAAQPSTGVRHEDVPEPRQSARGAASEVIREGTVDDKSRKKIAKAEQKRLKKEAKAEKKREV